MPVRCYSCRYLFPEDAITIDAGVGPRCTDTAACKARRQPRRLDADRLRELRAAWAVRIDGATPPFDVGRISHASEDGMVHLCTLSGSKMGWVHFSKLSPMADPNPTQTPRTGACENHECDGYALEDGTTVDWCPECGAFNDGNGWRLPRRLGGR